MVCHRCKIMVSDTLLKHGLQPLSVQLGEVTLAGKPDATVLSALSTSLAEIGFELMNDHKSRLIEKMKTFIIDTVHYDKQLLVKFSTALSQHIGHDYSYLSKLFSELEGITLEQFMIMQRVEKVKELITYKEMSLSQIALELGYSSTAHLSAQFKKVTGLTSSQFRSGSMHARKSLDDIGRR